MTFHGVPRALRCDQADAFKSKHFEIFCKDNNIKLILAQAGDHRGTGLVGGMKQKLKIQLFVITQTLNEQRKH